MTTETTVPRDVPAMGAADILREIRRTRRGHLVNAALWAFVVFACASLFVQSSPETRHAERYLWLAWAAVLSGQAAFRVMVERRRDAKAIAGGEYAARRRLRSLLKSQVEAGGAKWLWLVVCSATVVALFVWLPRHGQYTMPWLVIAAGMATRRLYECFVVGPRAAVLLASLGEPSAAEIEANVRQMLDAAAGRRVGRLDAIGYLHEEAGAAFMDAALLVDGIARSSAVTA